MPANNYEIVIKDFNDYIYLISDIADSMQKELCLFRGQDCDKPLIPSLGRLSLDNIAEYERNLFEDFRKRYRAYTSKTYDNDFDLLALAQHFELPTRLLDWTENALVALWFATEKRAGEDYGVVWVFYPEEENMLRGDESSPFEVGTTKVYCPNHVTERITAQAGWFTCHALTGNNTFKELETLYKYREKFNKLVIPSEIFTEVRVKLNLMGINSATIFPDLNSLARHLKWKHLKTEKF